MKKLSILSLVLVSASALTAAIAPSKAKDNASDKFTPGGIAQTSSGQNTCTVAGSGAACNVTANSGTTQPGGVTSGVFGTVGNTE